MLSAWDRYIELVGVCGDDESVTVVAWRTYAADPVEESEWATFVSMGTWPWSLTPKALEKPYDETMTTSKV